MADQDKPPVSENSEELKRIVQEVIELERRYYFEKRHGKTARQRELQRVIERYVSEDVGS